MIKYYIFDMPVTLQQIQDKLRSKDIGISQQGINGSIIIRFDENERFIYL